jgi:hypothetical protein
VFRLLFFLPSGVCEERHTKQDSLGLERHDIVGTELEVPVPKKMISLTVAIALVLQV